MTLTNHEDLSRENEALRGRIWRLSAAILRINASLELDTALHEVLEGARALTGARFGVIITIDAASELQDFASSGLTPDEHRQLANWTERPRLFEHLRGLPEPLRLADFSAYAISLGLPPNPMLTVPFQGTPMRHRGAHVGTFCLAEKEGGGEFTDDDEEILGLFASQAAAAIANARTHRDEQRARAEFLDMVSHELRALLTSIKGSTATVLGDSPDPDPAKMLQFFRIIDEQADHMRGLIGDLLDTGRIETGTLSANPDLVKPFSPTSPTPTPPLTQAPTELTARMRAARRRRPEPEPFMVGDLTIDYARRQVTVAGRPVRLTATEYELLRILSLNAGWVTTYDVLLRNVWGGRAMANTGFVRSLIKNLRRKLGDDASRPTYIFSERGIGYRLAGPEDVLG